MSQNFAKMICLLTSWNTWLQNLLRSIMLHIMRFLMEWSPFLPERLFIIQPANPCCSSQDRSNWRWRILGNQGSGRPVTIFCVIYRLQLKLALGLEITHHLSTSLSQGSFTGDKEAQVQFSESRNWITALVLSVSLCPQISNQPKRLVQICFWHKKLYRKIGTVNSAWQVILRLTVCGGNCLDMTISQFWPLTD